MRAAAGPVARGWSAAVAAVMVVAAAARALGSGPGYPACCLAWAVRVAGGLEGS